MRFRASPFFRWRVISISGDTPKQLEAPLQLKNRRESIAMSPEQKEPESRNNHGHRHSGAIEENMVEQDVHNNRTQHGQPQRGKTATY